MMRQVILTRTPKFGEDNDFADNIAKALVDKTVELVESYPPTPVRRASRRAIGCHHGARVFGRVMGASPDGRKAGMPVSEGVSPVQGSDRKGIAAVFRSVSKCDWDKTGGALLNQKLTPDIVEDPETLKKLGQLIRSFFTWADTTCSSTWLAQSCSAKLRKDQQTSKISWYALPATVITL